MHHRESVLSYLNSGPSLSPLTATDDEASPERMRCLASELNELKRGFLHELRTQYIQERVTLEGEDIDVERVVAAAVAAFDREMKETLFRFREK